MILGKSYLGGTEIEKIYLGADVVYEVDAGVTNYYSWVDAATPVNDAPTIELSTTLGWENSGSIYSVEGTDVYTDGGSSAIKVGVDNGSNDRLLLWFDNLTIGSQYTIVFFVKKYGDSDAQITFSSNITPSLAVGFSSFPNEVWNEYSHTFTVDALPIRIPFYAARVNGGTAPLTNNYILIDSITLTEL